MFPRPDSAHGEASTGATERQDFIRCRDWDDCLALASAGPICSSGSRLPPDRMTPPTINPELPPDVLGRADGAEGADFHFDAQACHGALTPRVVEFPQTPQIPAIVLAAITA